MLDDSARHRLSGFFLFFTSHGLFSNMKVDKIAIFKQTEMFRELDDAVLGVLTKHAVLKRLQRNEILFLAGEPAKGMYVIASGSVRAYRTSPDGREQVIHTEGAGATIAEVPVFDDGNYPSTVAAEETTTLFFLEKEKIRSACLQHPQLALAAVRLLASRLRRCATLVETLSLHPVGQRLARFLAEEAALRGIETPDGIKFKLNLTHNQLAARMGTVREVVTRAFYRLQAQGLISVLGKEVIIVDAVALLSFSDQNSH